jgi:hypothetical protein
VIAEGIEHAEELQVVRDLGIFLGQGYFIARPEARPQRAITAQVQEVVNERRAYVHQQPSQLGAGNVTLERIASHVQPVSPDTRSEDMRWHVSRAIPHWKYCRWWSAIGRWAC